MIGERIYIFGGQGQDEQLYNDLFQVQIHEKIDQQGNILKFVAEWIEVTIQPKVPRNLEVQRPRARTSHSCVPYKSRYLILIGGEAASVSEEGQEHAHAQIGVDNKNQLANPESQAK
jgi:hypothetical protein